MVRNIIISSTLLLSAATATAIESPDTIIRATNVDVTITENAGGLVISATGDSTEVSHIEPYSDNMSIRSTRRRPMNTVYTGLGSRGNITWDIISGNLMLGFVCTPGAPTELDLEPAKSIEISWMNAVGALCYFKNIRSSISAGIGFSWRNYRTTTGMRFTRDDNGTIGYEPFGSNVTPKYSRLKVFSLSFPFLFSRYFKSACIQAGPVLNWNTHASMRNRWIDAEGHKQTFSSNKAGQRAFTVDLYGAVRIFNGIGVYVRYSPMSVLKRSPDLDFTTLSTGFVVGI